MPEVLPHSALAPTAVFSAPLELSANELVPTDLEAELPRGMSPAFDGLTVRID